MCTVLVVKISGNTKLILCELSDDDDGLMTVTRSKKHSFNTQYFIDQQCEGNKQTQRERSRKVIISQL
jgi:hypothetical protein